MKRVEAIVRPDRLEAVKDALAALGHQGMTVSTVLGHGIQGGIVQEWRGEDYPVDLLPKTAIVAIVQDHEVTEVVESIVAAARTDRMGDGKIFVSTVDEVVRIRTGERGPGAV